MAIRGKSVKGKVVSSKKYTVSEKAHNLTVLPGGKLNNFLNILPDKVTNFRKSKTFYILLIALGILLLAIFKKDWFVAATVNGSLVSNLELQTRLNQQFRTQTLNQMINEKIILTEAAKNNALATDEEVTKKISEIETSVGGAEALNSLLSQQGQTRESIRQQIKVQLSIEKLYTNEATVSAEEVNQFIEQNREQLQATDSAGQQKEATDAIKSQKLSQLFAEKFQTLRSQAKIQIF
ncbi:SurA N-terminal domain-containing protein [Candidatus Daviesbacteria bacterium]|nr:SurA N-terminal domain-containing protein [Candidatus Daviesbacteria bacterium]